MTETVDGVGPKKRLIINVLANTLSTVPNALCGFVMLPLLISKLGRETYGVWIMIVASAGHYCCWILAIWSCASARSGSRSRNDLETSIDTGNPNGRMGKFS